MPYIGNSVKQICLAVVAVGLGLASGYLYLMSFDLMILAVLVLASAMALGAAQSRRPWIVALLLSLAIPMAAVLVRMRGLPVYSGQIESAAVAGLASALLGAYAGAFLRRMVAGLFGQKT